MQKKAFGAGFCRKCLRRNRFLPAYSLFGYAFYAATCIIARPAAAPPPSFTPAWSVYVRIANYRIANERMGGKNAA
jgi:hypothetical protein